MATTSGKPLASCWRCWRTASAGELLALQSAMGYGDGYVGHGLWVMASVMVAIADELLSLPARHSDLKFPGSVYRHVLASITR